MRGLLPTIVVSVCVLAACDDVLIGDDVKHPGPGPPPTLRFGTIIDGEYRLYAPIDSSIPPDTVGAIRPLSITYRGFPGTGEIRAYKYRSLTPGLHFPGGDVWNTDVSDTVRFFDGYFRAKLFKIAVMCVDDRFQSEESICQVAVNFTPETEMVSVTNWYFKRRTAHLRRIDFLDGVPDTVSYGSWVRLMYRGWDDSRDSTVCDSAATDLCVDFKVRFDRQSARYPRAGATSGWLPRSGTHDTNPGSAIDSNSVNIGSSEYDLFVRAVDENFLSDQTPARVSIIGNFDPVLDDVSVEDHFGDLLNLAVHDTLTWNFWRGKGWPYDSLLDTVDVFSPGYPFYKTFGMTVRARGHDHPLDPDGSGVHAWRYLFFDDLGNFWPLGRSGSTWYDAAELNALDEDVEVTLRYHDPAGDTVFADLPGYLNRDLTLMVTGRDTAVDHEFEQFAFLNGERTLVNAYPDGELGRWTEERAVTFHLRLVR